MSLCRRSSYTYEEYLKALGNAYPARCALMPAACKRTNHWRDLNHRLFRRITFFPSPCTLQFVYGVSFTLSVSRLNPSRRSVERCLCGSSGITGAFRCCSEFSSVCHAHSSLWTTDLEIQWFPLHHPVTPELHSPQLPCSHCTRKRRRRSTGSFLYSSCLCRISGCDIHQKPIQQQRHNVEGFSSRLVRCITNTCEHCT